MAQTCLEELSREHTYYEWLSLPRLSMPSFSLLLLAIVRRLRYLLVLGVYFGCILVVCFSGFLSSGQTFTKTDVALINWFILLLPLVD